MKEKDLSGKFSDHSLNYSDLTKTIGEVLNIDGVSEELKEELKKYPENYCVWIVDGENRIVVSPPSIFQGSENLLLGAEQMSEPERNFPSAPGDTPYSGSKVYNEIQKRTEEYMKELKDCNVATEVLNLLKVAEDMDDKETSISSGFLFLLRNVAASSDDLSFGRYSNEFCEMMGGLENLELAQDIAVAAYREYLLSTGEQFSAN